MTKVNILKLRNRNLNRFKARKVAVPIAKSTIRLLPNNKFVRKLRSNSSTGSSSPNSELAKPSSPQRGDLA